MSARAAGNGRGGRRQRGLGSSRRPHLKPPRSGSPGGRAPETKRSGSPDAAGGRSSPVSSTARQRVPALARSAAGRRGLKGGKMPRVVPDQRSKFENEEFFRKLSRECEVRRVGGAEASARPEWARDGEKFERPGSREARGGAAPEG